MAKTNKDLEKEVLESETNSQTAEISDKDSSADLEALSKHHAMKVKNPLKTLGRLFGYIFKGHGVKFILVFIFIMLSSFASVQSMAMINDLILEIGVQLDGLKSIPYYQVVYDGVLKVIFKMVAIFLVGIAATTLYNQFTVVIAQNVLRNIRNEMFEKMQRFPVKYFDTNTFGETMSRYTNDTDTLEMLISNSVPNIFSSVVTILVCLVQMLVMSWQLTLVVLITVFLMFFVIKGIGKKSAFYFIARQKSVGKLNGFVEEMLNGQKVVQVFCYEDENQKAFDTVNDEWCLNSTNANKYANIFMPIMANLGYVQYVIVAVVGGLMANHGLLSLADADNTYAALALVSAFLSLSRSFTRPINQVSQQFNAVVMALAGAERVFELMDVEPEADAGYVTLVKAVEVCGEIKEGDGEGWFWAWKHPHGDGTLTYSKLEGHVLLKEVDFSYDGEKMVLNDITVEAMPGQKVALIGKTGAGKTTISNLINRFYDIADGKIRYDGININKIKKDDLRRSLGVVLQEVNLFTDTVKENIRYGNPDATDEEIYAAAKLVHADDFIKRLPDGYDTVLTLDGANLSQGQRQLLAIARVAVADPPVMILDEATSSIDTRTEAIVQSGMDNLMKGRTTFVIAHRLSTVRNSDNIMVMDSGKIVEQGNHDALMEKEGMYFSLYTGATL